MRLEKRTSSSRAALLLYPFVLTVLLGAPRLIFRAWKDHSLQQAVEGAERVLILGAGQAGEALVRDLRRLGQYDPIGFLDDAVKLRGSHLHGVPVLGKIEEVARIAPETAAKLLVIAMPSLDAQRMRRVIEACERTGLPFRMVPRLNDILEGNGNANFFEGMGCVGGCVGGPKALIPREEGRKNVIRYGAEASYETPIDNPYVIALLHQLGLDTIESLLEKSDIFVRKL